ncbi:MAG: undecaprenyl-diphosphate phosphatase [Candidatus Bathyarchaeales archaeon]
MSWIEQLIKIIVLGLIQGFTEWLPISSTGHLKLTERLLQFSSPKDSLIFDFALHIGTLIVVIFFFRREIREILRALARLDFKTKDGKMMPLIVAGTIPAIAVGFLLEKTVETRIAQNFTLIATAFILCGIVLYITKMGEEKTDEISFSKAIIVGVAEGIAIIPGLSRSGLTIAAALLLGLKREKAFKFSFLLSIPAVIGAIGYTFYTEYEALASAGLGLTETLVGVIVSMVVGYFALKILWRTLAVKKFHLFAFYCWLVGVLLIVLSLSGF